MPHCGNMKNVIFIAANSIKTIRRKRVAVIIHQNLYDSFSMMSKARILDQRYRQLTKLLYNL